MWLKTVYLLKDTSEPERTFKLKFLYKSSKQKGLLTVSDFVNMGLGTGNRVEPELTDIYPGKNSYED